MSAADDLQSRLENGRSWPLPDEVGVMTALTRWSAMRDSDEARLRGIANWAGDRSYVIDPLGTRIPEVWADLIHGKDADYVAAAEGDQETLDQLLETNAMASEMQRAEIVCSSEGEVWWRVYVDQEAADYPIVEWHSRKEVLPLWRGRQLLAVAFIGELPNDDESDTVHRHVEIQAKGEVMNLLYTGRRDQLGSATELGVRDETAGLEEAWKHGLPLMLAGRVANRLGREPRLGVSDYAGVYGLLLSLNEATSIGIENLRLTGKKRVVVPPEYLDAKGNFPAGAEVIIANEPDRDPDKPMGLAQIEWSYDAAALVLGKDDIVDTILTRARVAPQLVGRNTEGAQTGPALRARLLDSVLAADGKARPWDDAVPQILMSCMLVDQLPTEQGGFGRPWAQAAEPPSYERSSTLPVDEESEALRHSTLVGAGIEAKRTAIEDLHPDWDEERVDEELQNIKGDAPPSPLGGPLFPPRRQTDERLPPELDETTPRPENPEAT